MLGTIYLHEVRYWFKLPLFYIYTGVLFLLSVLIMAISVGVFDFSTVTVTSPVNINAPVMVWGIISELSILVYLLIPSLVGGTIQRDFSNNMHNVLYSYPLSRVQYIIAKFLAGISVTLLTVLASILGLIVGTYLPGHNEFLLGPFEIMNYLEPFLYFIIPNVIFFGAIVFAITAFARNINLGFITVLVLIIARSVMSSYVDQADDPYIYLLLDPTGAQAVAEILKDWTMIEQNENSLPFSGAVLDNRLLWGGIGLLVFAIVAFTFRFRQHAAKITLIRKKAARSVKSNFGVITQVNLPKVSTDFTLLSNLRTAWNLSKTDIRYIVTGWPFIIIAVISFAFSLVTMLVAGEVYGTAILPKTWLMLQVAASLFILLLYLLIFLYGGLIMDRARSAHIFQMVHASPVKNWVLLMSKFIALCVMVLTMYILVILSGMFIQTWNGFTEYQLDVYLYDLYVIKFFQMLPWIVMTLFIHTLVKNKWLGIAVLLLIAAALPPILNAVGMEQDQFIFNQGGPTPAFSDMNHYGTELPKFWVYRVYWFGFSLALFVLSVVLYRRGTGQRVVERIAFAKAKFQTPQIALSALGLLVFVGLGSWIWYANNIVQETKSGKEWEMLQVNYEKELSRYAKTPQPRITGVNINLDLYPEDRDFSAVGKFTLVNKTDAPIDTLIVSYNDGPLEMALNRDAEIVYDNEEFEVRMYKFTESLKPGDSVLYKFEMENEENTLLVTRSPVIQNGTFLNNMMFPTFGYSKNYEIADPQLREKYDLPPRDRMPSPDEPGATDNNYIGGTADWIDFEATVSTSGDQTAIAPGYLLRQWVEDGRNYFHYKMDSKMVNFYAFLSGRYELLEEEHEGVKLQIFHHPEHDYNLDRMMKGLRVGLDYYSEAFTPYQHRQARIIEFPKRYGSFAQAFANTIPFSEGIGFIAAVEDDKPNAVDYPLSITAHELAHQWWAHQVIGANAQGSTLLSESLSEYSSLKVLQEVYGKGQMRKFLKDALDGYLRGRSAERIGERPLMYNENQQYIHYNKGSLVLYALSDYWGEENLNGVISDFAEKYQFKGPPYPTGKDFVEMIEQEIPDSLAYMVDDMFREITLYDNKAVEAEYSAVAKGNDTTYTVTLDAYVTKYRNTPKGKELYSGQSGDSLTYAPEGKKKMLKSLPLEDYVEVGIFGKLNPKTDTREILYLQKHKVSEINNEFEIIVGKKPEEAGIDPFNKLIDRKSRDNRIEVKKAKVAVSEE